jgi:hypothetical protein
MSCRTPVNVSNAFSLEPKILTDLVVDFYFLATSFLLLSRTIRKFYFDRKLISRVLAKILFRLTLLHRVGTEEKVFLNTRFLSGI